ncbi:MAG: STAS domain-containing protein [Sedimentisphaerales bacterium]|nr:STAS domain-containing protein [Sedimentisphaerales bacterium]
MAIQDWSDEIILADVANDPDFSDELNTLADRVKNNPKDVVVNFAKVKYLNSSNISLLLKLRKILIDNKFQLLLCEIPVQVWGVFLLTGLDAIFDVAEDNASALASLQMNK